MISYNIWTHINREKTEWLIKNQIAFVRGAYCNLVTKIFVYSYRSVLTS